jgi:membrane-bound lytic murein transglycosylase B
VNLKNVVLILATALLHGSGHAQPSAMPAGAMSDIEFRACVDKLAATTSLALRPLTRESFQSIAAGAKYQDGVRKGSIAQVAEPTLVWDDLAATTDDERVADGLRVIDRAAQVLSRIEARWGVPKEIIIALYGVETDYGPRQGSIPVLDAALTRACLSPCPDSPRAKCALRERAYAAVRVLRDGHVRTGNFYGSWAAAFGRTQFVPDTFEELAIDFDGDGKKDVVDTESDAWASTANFLRNRGQWIPGLPMYVEVQVPPSEMANYGSTAELVRYPEGKRKWIDWQRSGWHARGDFDRSLGAQVPPSTPMHLVLPAGVAGPALLVTSNYTAVLSYNPGSPAYPLKVGLLARKLAGGQEFVARWPTDDPGLSRAEIKTLQTWLVAQGHQDVQVDGIPGPKTRDAIQVERQKHGLSAGRRVGKESLKVLMLVR